ncbi:MAG: SMC-Scp complex subunit ScpB [Planctomycetes bacterium]|nr:SMC-Scp complex subunit ScpB [Planctomycetota bacterium]
MQRLTMNEPKFEKKVAMPELPVVPELKLNLDKPENALDAECLISADSVEIRDAVVEDAVTNIENPDAELAQIDATIDETSEIPEETVLIADPNIEELSKTLEALLFVSKDPLKPEKIKQILGLTSIIPIRKAADRLQKFYNENGRAYELREIAEGYLLQTRITFEDSIQKLRKAKRELKITQNALTTLSIVAYKQPITRSEIDSIRGANSSHHMKNLLDNALVKVVGKKETPGSPRLYGTSKRFLEIFGLKSLSGLPKSTEAFEERPKKAAKKTDPAETTQENTTVEELEITPEFDELREIQGKKREIIDPDEFK